MTAQSTVKDQRPVQFRIRHLFWLTAAVGAVAALGAQIGWGVAVGGTLLTLSLAGLCFAATRIPAALLLVVLVFFVLMSSVTEPRSAVRQSVCRHNLRQLGQALHCYYEAFGCFPPAYVVDAEGRPIHSWRTLILPYLDEKARYAQIALAESWDSPTNQPYCAVPVDAFWCPAATKTIANETNYFAVIGPGTAWPGATCTTLEDFRDGISNTILLLEIPDAGVAWAEPKDWRIHEILMAAAGKGNVRLKSHPGGFCALFADGSVRTLPADIAAEKLNALLTINGGETVGEF